MSATLIEALNSPPPASTGAALWERKLLDELLIGSQLFLHPSQVEIQSLGLDSDGGHIRLHGPTELGEMDLSFRRELGGWGGFCSACGLDLEWVVFTEGEHGRGKKLAPSLVYCVKCAPQSLEDYVYPGSAHLLIAYAAGTVDNEDHLRDYVDFLTSTVLEAELVLRQYMTAFAIIGENWKHLRAGAGHHG